MQIKWYSATQVAEMRNMAVATVIGLIEDGVLEAVNYARESSTRKRWQISEAMLSAFDERRTSKQTPSPETKSTGRKIQRAKKDYFATTEAGGK